MFAQCYEDLKSWMRSWVLTRITSNYCIGSEHGIAMERCEGREEMPLFRPSCLGEMVLSSRGTETQHRSWTVQTAEEVKHSIKGGIQLNNANPQNRNYSNPGRELQILSCWGPLIYYTFFIPDSCTTVFWLKFSPLQHETGGVVLA